MFKKFAFSIAGFTLGFLFLGMTSVRAEHQLIKDMDHDGDKKLSWAEVEAIGWNKELFDLKDMNGDGFIDESDLWAHVAWTKKPILSKRILKAMDTDGDGKVQKHEQWWWGEKDFKKYDKNKDGVLGASELSKIPKATDPKAFKAKWQKSKHGK